MDSQVSDNLIQLLPDVADEEDCNHYCSLNSHCTYYTFYRSTATLIPGTFLLFSRVDKPFRAVNHCMTGAADCSNNQGVCLFSSDREVVKRVQLTMSNSYTVAQIPLGPVGILVL